jgi:hypothetical protein
VGRPDPLLRAEFRPVGHKAALTVVNMLFVQSFELSFSSRCRGGRAPGVPGRGRVA